jgi:hemoglobin-like flavoprotein
MKHSMASTAVAIEPDIPAATDERAALQQDAARLRSKTPAMAVHNQVFISYAHADASWRDEFIEMFGPAVKRGSIRLWSDENIPVGQDWSKSIALALNSASAGLLLVTPQFLRSEYITNVELERLLSLAKTSGVAIHWVPISPTLYTETPLGTIQAAWDPARPLDQLPVPEQRAAIQQICLQIVEDFGFLPKVTGGRRQSLPREVQSRLGDKYELGDEIGAGRFSIVYRAQQRNPSRTVSVKVLVASEFDDWARPKFEDAAEKAAELTSPAFIKIIESSMDEHPELVVTELVQGEPLSKYLMRYPNGVPLGTARNILLDLAQAIEEVHQKSWTRGEMCSSNILVDSTGAARLSTVDFTTVLSEESQMGGNFFVDRESLAYMTPERFFGRAATQLTDQYSLGLIAVELLGGERIPRVAAPCDLEGRRRLFADLESGNGRWARRSPEFAGIVSRLLRTDPLERWHSMRDVCQFLRDIEVAESEAEICRKAAKASYLRLQLAGTERALFARFYQILFAGCPEVKKRFAAIDMERQYKILNSAIQLLLEFDPERGSVPLRDLANRHSPFGLTRRHYNLFLESLLDAIEESGVDATQLAAWRRTMTPAVDFMCKCQGIPMPTRELAEGRPGSTTDVAIKEAR